MYQRRNYEALITRAQSIKFAAVKKYVLALNLDLDKVILTKEDATATIYAPLTVSSLLSKEKNKIKKGSYRNKANELRKAWQDLLRRLLKN